MDPITYLVDNIIFTENVEGSRDAKHALFEFLFTCINNKEYYKINALINSSELKRLTHTYLLTILNICHKHKENIPGYQDFFDQVKEYVKPLMTEENYQLTFQYLK